MNDDMNWMINCVLEHLPGYLRRYSPEMSDELRRIDPEYERAYKELPPLVDMRDDPILRAADRLEGLLQNETSRDNEIDPLKELLKAADTAATLIEDHDESGRPAAILRGAIDKTDDWKSTADQDALGRIRLARALDVNLDQDVEAVWHQIERRVGEALSAKAWADQVLQKSERPDNPPKTFDMNG